MSVQTGERTGFVPTPERAEAIAREVAAMIEALRAAVHSGDDLEMRAGPRCRWCPLLDRCAEGTAAIEILSGP